MPFKRILLHPFDFFFCTFLAPRLARKLRTYLPLLGMTRGESLVVASSGYTCGQALLSGFTVPVFYCEVFEKTKKGWETHKVTIAVTATGRLNILGDGVTPISFRDARARPLVQFLKTIWFIWPYTIYMTATAEQISMRQPKTVA